MRKIEHASPLPFVIPEGEFRRLLEPYIRFGRSLEEALLPSKVGPGSTSQEEFERANMTHLIHSPKSRKPGATFADVKPLTYFMFDEESHHVRLARPDTYGNNALNLRENRYVTVADDHPVRLLTQPQPIDPEPDPDVCTYESESAGTVLRSSDGGLHMRMIGETERVQTTPFRADREPSEEFQQMWEKMKRGHADNGSGAPGCDWTADERGRSNSSARFVELTEFIREGIVHSSRELFSGYHERVARRILAGLAHRHGLAPHDAQQAGRGR